jgi:hypothetical protein
MKLSTTWMWIALAIVSPFVAHFVSAAGQQ